MVGITGSTGKTSTKDILYAMLAPVFRGRVHANRENFNTEIGLPLTVLEANIGVQVLVLEMAMRGMGQIRELAQIARPDVGVITNIGPVHLELVGSVEQVAEAKAELIAELPPGGACVVPAGRGGAASSSCARTCGRSRSAPEGDVRALSVAPRRRRAGPRSTLRSRSSRPCGRST